MTFSGTDGHMTRSEGSRPVIELRHLTKRYGPILAVDDLSFTVAAGQVTGFLGPNGSGKSTTMRMIVGLDAPTAGQVTVAGRSYGKLRFPLREVGALLDASAVHPGRTARTRRCGCQRRPRAGPAQRVHQPHRGTSTSSASSASSSGRSPLR